MTAYQSTIIKAIETFRQDALTDIMLNTDDFLHAPESIPLELSQTEIDELTKLYNDLLYNVLIKLNFAKVETK